MKQFLLLFFWVALQSSSSLVLAQKKSQLAPTEQCGTMQRLEAKFKKDPSLKIKFEQQFTEFNNRLDQAAAKPAPANKGNAREAATYTIPVVFHVLLKDQKLVTDAQIAAQLDVLNKTFGGRNADSTGLPSHFKPLFGKSSIQFCMAQRTPSGAVTDGIDRVTVTKASFSNNPADSAKHTTLGGINLWDGSKYFNVWVCALSGSLLGYATFPNDGRADEEGVVMDYRTLPGGATTNYNQGKTLTHETGHYFNLLHIWGDDNGTCNGSDAVGDTPNQGDATSGCYKDIKKDGCTSTGYGILYQNYMDYSYDPCLLLFTKGQVTRMESSLNSFRASLLSSDGCLPAVLKNLNAQLKTINAPEPRLCGNTFTPKVTIRNLGSQTLTSLSIKIALDNGTPINYNWTGSLASLAYASVNLNALTVAEGQHSLKIFTASPNGGIDGDYTNDTLTTNIQYFNPVQTIAESFEGAAFPPQGWDILNVDKGITWEKVTGIAKTGNSSLLLNNFNYSNTDQQDYLRLPSLTLPNLDSAFLSFQVAASTTTPTNTAGNNWDTLEVLVSKDCGATYTSLYKKWGAKLVTTAYETTENFVPASNEWRKDSIDLSAYINQGAILVAFRNTTGFENNIYLDDINLRTISINPYLRAAGYLVTPNPATDNILVQFYPNPTKLQSIQLFNSQGQKMTEKSIIPGFGITAYSFSIGSYPAGTYWVRSVFSDKTLVKKIIKL